MQAPPTRLVPHMALVTVMDSALKTIIAQVASSTTITLIHSQTSATLSNLTWLIHATSCPVALAIWTLPQFSLVVSVKNKSLSCVHAHVCSCFWLTNVTVVRTASSSDGLK